MRYVKMSFSSAKVFHGSFNPTFENSSNTSGKPIYRTKVFSKSSDTAIPVNCVANMLAVLCGERPVSSMYRVGDRKLPEKFFDIARRAHVRVDTSAKNVENMTHIKSAFSPRKGTTGIRIVLDGNEFIPKHWTVPDWRFTERRFGKFWDRFDCGLKSILGSDYKKQYTSLDIIPVLRKKYRDGQPNVVSLVDDIHFDALEDKNYQKMVSGWIIPVKTGKFPVSGSKTPKGNKILCGDGAFRQDSKSSDVDPVYLPRNISGPERVLTVNGSMYVKLTDEECGMFVRKFARFLGQGTVCVEEIKGSEWTDDIDELPPPEECAIIDLKNKNGSSAD